MARKLGFKKEIKNKTGIVVVKRTAILFNFPQRISLNESSKRRISNIPVRSLNMPSANPALSQGINNMYKMYSLNINLCS